MPFSMSAYRQCLAQACMPTCPACPSVCSTLTGIADERVRALFLIDPVDVTIYAPLGPGAAHLKGLAVVRVVQLGERRNGTACLAVRCSRLLVWMAAHISHSP